jgi:hypothetical protein
MWFEDLPMTLLFVAIGTGVLDCPELASAPPLTTFFKTFASFIASFYMLYKQASSTGENTILYSLENMTAKLNWLPYLKQMRTTKDSFDIDFGNLEANLPIVSHYLGYKMPVNFNMSKQIITVLANELKTTGHKEKNQDGEVTIGSGSTIKSRIRLTGACNDFTINDLLFFYSLVD